MEIRTFTSMAMPWTIYCDFDGTISTEDITDTLLDTFGMPGWQELEQRWVAGEIDWVKSRSRKKLPTRCYSCPQI